MPQKPRRSVCGPEHLGERGELDRDRRGSSRCRALRRSRSCRRDRPRPRTRRRSPRPDRGCPARCSPTLSLPSLLMPTPRITARMPSPSASASSSRFEHDEADTASDDRALGVGVERPAVAVGRQDRAGDVEVAAALRDADRHAAGERHVAPTDLQALARHADRDQRRGARRLHDDARARAGSSRYETCVHRWSLSLVTMSCMPSM